MFVLFGPAHTSGKNFSNFESDSFLKDLTGCALTNYPLRLIHPLATLLIKKQAGALNYNAYSKA